MRICFPPVGCHVWDSRTEGSLGSASTTYLSRNRRGEQQERSKASQQDWSTEHRRESVGLSSRESRGVSSNGGGRVKADKEIGEEGVVMYKMVGEVAGWAPSCISALLRTSTTDRPTAPPDSARCRPCCVTRPGADCRNLGDSHRGDQTIWPSGHLPRAVAEPTIPWHQIEPSQLGGSEAPIQSRVARRCSHALAPARLASLLYRLAGWLSFRYQYWIAQVQASRSAGAERHVSELACRHPGCGATVLTVLNLGCTGSNRVYQSTTQPSGFSKAECAPSQAQVRSVWRRFCMLGQQTNPAFSLAPTYP